MILIKDYYKPTEANNFPELKKKQLLEKYIQRKALIVVEKDKTEFHSVHDKDVLSKSLEYYANREEVKKVFWLYTADLIQ
jgi:hypothetical protein